LVRTNESTLTLIERADDDGDRQEEDMDIESTQSSDTLEYVER
jgi:hypothetical protein